MGTVVHGAAADAVVVATGTRTEFGRIAAGLGDVTSSDRVSARPAPVLGARSVYVAGALTTSIFVVNVAAAAGR